MEDFNLFQVTQGNCGCNATPTQATGCCGPASQTHAEQFGRGVLNIELLVIDLATCQRCVPTGHQLKAAVELLNPVATALGIGLKHHERVVQTPGEAKERALLSSPTIRINGRDIDQDIRESVCESCGDLTENNTSIDCREWHYRGGVYSAAPVSLLIEAIMRAMLNIDALPPIDPAPLKELPENLQRYFENKKANGNVSCCS